MKIKMTSLPRRSGKTSILLADMLRCYAHDNTAEIIYLGISHSDAKDKSLLLRKLGLGIRCESPYSFIENYIHYKGISGKRFYIFIDEPFMMSYEDQATIIRFIMSDKRNEWNVFGMGTTTECEPIRFQDFINN